MCLSNKFLSDDDDDDNNNNYNNNNVDNDDKPYHWRNYGYGAEHIRSK
jgi:hypothetical protein